MRKAKLKVDEFIKESIENKKRRKEIIKKNKKERENKENMKDKKIS